MRAHLFALLFLVWLMPSPGLYAQFGLPTLDGSVTPGEYTGNAYAVPGGEWFITWNNDHLFIAKTGGGANHPVVIFIDTDPEIPVNHPVNGMLQGANDWGYQANLPFNADVKVYWEVHGAGAFASVERENTGAWGNAQDNTNHPATVSIAAGAGQGEFRMAWAYAGGRPAAFNIMMYQIDRFSPFVYHSAPNLNAEGAIGGIDVNRYFYFSVPNTNDPTALDAFGNVSFTQFNGGSYNYNFAGPVLFDFTINDNAPDNSDNDEIHDGAPVANRVMAGENIEIRRHVYIAQGSALLPMGGETPTLQLSGPDSRLYNLGRIDANPDISSLAAIAATSLSFIFSGATRLMPSPLTIDRYRLGNIFIPTGGSLLGSNTGVSRFEVQWGVLQVNGTLDLYSDAGNYTDLVFRGFVSPLENEYFLTGSGFAEFHNFIIGTDLARVRPVASITPAALELRIMGNFGVFGAFEARNDQAVLSVCMCGEKRQQIEGQVGQTEGGEVTFAVLRINNDNGLNNSNAGADVYFITYDNPPNIDYFIDEALLLQSGDLVTRNGGVCNAGGEIHRLTLLAGASVAFADSVFTDAAVGPPSSHVEGPLRREVSASPAATVYFPVGKGGASRAMGLSVAHSDPTPVVYVVELNECPPPGLSMAPTGGLPANEQLDIRPQPRHWVVGYNPDGNPAAPAVTSAFFTAFYDTDDTNGLLDPLGLRIIRDNGSGGYENLGGSTATLGPGKITSQFDVTAFGIISFGFPLVMNSDTRLELSAIHQGNHTLLSWELESRQAAWQYEVWKEEGTARWRELGRTAGDELAFHDPQPGSLTSQYQVIARLADGGSVASNVVEVRNEMAGFQLFVQSPATDRLQARLVGAEGVITLRLWNALGQEAVPATRVDTYGVEWMWEAPISLAPGIYWLEAVSEGKKVVQPVRVTSGN